MQKKLFVLMSHTMTPAQIEDARTRLNATEIVEVPSAFWGQIPADCESVRPYTEEIKLFLGKNANKGDLLLVQGDFGATVEMVSYAFANGLVPIYATTRRVAKDRIDGDRVVTERTFEHVRFRVYEMVGVTCRHATAETLNTRKRGDACISY